MAISFSNPWDRLQHNNQNGSDRDMGHYFDKTATRSAVMHNFNSIRKMFGLSVRQLTELIQPIANIPYSRFRRLVAGERDITPEELAALHELLGVPPTTFLYPWSLQPHTKIQDFFSHNPKVQPSIPSNFYRTGENPIFDYFGPSLYPYQYTNLGSWLAGQTISEITSKSASLYLLSRSDSPRDVFLQLFQEASCAYVKQTFSQDDFDSAFHSLEETYPLNSSITHLGNVDNFLNKLGQVLLCYLHQIAYLSYYNQITSDRESNIVGRQMTEETRSLAERPAQHSDRHSAQLLNYIEHTDLTIESRITTPYKINQNHTERLILKATDYKTGQLLGKADIHFEYASWFDFIAPTRIKALCEIAQNRKTDIQNGEYIISAGEVRDLLFTKNYEQPQLKFILPEFDTSLAG